LDRRQFVSLSLGGLLPLFACGAAGPGPSARFTPEGFGAAGDGTRDDYDAFARLVEAVNRAGGGTVELNPGRTYRLNRYIASGSPAHDLVFSDCEGLTIIGNGARIRVKGDLERTAASVRSLAGLTFRDCRRIVLARLELAGGVEQSRRSRGLTEPPSHGLVFQGCSDVTIDDVIVRHFAADGLYIRESSRPDQNGIRRASRDFRVRNSRFLFNARQGMSIVQLRGGLFENCQFSYTGYVDVAGNTGSYGAHSPGAGVDIEPNRNPASATPVDVLTGDILIRGCRLTGNVGAALVAAKYVDSMRFIEDVTIDSCQIECGDGTAAGRDGLIFDVPGGIVRNCTLRMRDKTAYLGWYPDSDADTRFLGNQLYGRNSGRNRPIFAVRPTRGSPLIEGNRFVGEQRVPKDPRGAWLVFIDNPNATARMNSIFMPAAAFPAGGQNSVPIVFARANLMDRNIYATDLAALGSSFAVVYAGGTRARNETYRGPLHGPRGTIRPVHREGS
jgi:hypothetical protein